MRKVVGASKAPLNVAVIGTGYVGLTTGACFAKLGHNVICADVIPEKIEMLSRGVVPMVEAGMDELVAEGIASGRLRFVLGAANAVEQCDFAFMCLPTPQGADGAADLSYLLTAASQIAPVLPKGAIVVNKSTVPVGSADKVVRVLGRGDVAVASNPEFLREGSSIADFFAPDRIVIGAATPAVARRVAKLYAQVDAPKLLVDTPTAELIKYASNAFLATKISFANSIAALCEEAGANAHQVLDGMGYDSRIGKKFLQPGPGWGGSCFPKDVMALMNIANEAGYSFDLLQAVVDANDTHRDRIVARTRQMLDGDLAGKTIAVWGLSFKAGTDDIRESPSIHIIRKLMAQGAHIQAYDPGVTKPIAGIQMMDSALSACQGAQILLVLTEWPEFGDVDLAAVADRMDRPHVLDTRNILDLSSLAGRGFTYSSIGHGQLVLAPQRV